MAQIPIDREIKLIFLGWLKDGVDEQDFSHFMLRYPITSEEDAVFDANFNRHLHDKGECDLLKRLGKCFPYRSIAQHKRLDL